MLRAAGVAHGGVAEISGANEWSLLSTKAQRLRTAAQPGILEVASAFLAS